MKNVTIPMDDDLAQRARVAAAQGGKERLQIFERRRLEQRSMPTTPR